MAHDRGPTSRNAGPPQSEPIATLSRPPLVSLPVETRRYEVVDFAEVAGVPCPVARRGGPLPTSRTFPARCIGPKLPAMHGCTITAGTPRCTTSWSVTDAAMELDNDRLSVHPGMCVLIRPGVRHQALGQMTVIIVCLPKFDPSDEWFD